MEFSSEKVKVWDLFVRIFHWTVVTLFFCNYVLSDRGMPFARGNTLHRYAGYIIIGFVLARLVWGIIGTKNARFKNFIPNLTEFKNYMRAMLRGEHPYYEGHNPAGAVMIICLLSGLLLTGLTGWLATLGDAIDGWQATVAAATDFINWGHVHSFFANLTMLGAGIHITAVVVVSHLTRENLVHAMLSGYKKKPK
jgi:Cytochrome b